MRQEPSLSTKETTEPTPTIRNDDDVETFAFFGPTSAHTVAQGGFCISVFVLLEQQGRILLVIPNAHERWMKEWTPNWRIYSAEQLEVELRSWRLPSTYVKLGESPDEALDRVMKEQLGVSGTWNVLSSELYNFYGLSRRYPGKMHWDYCFVYRVLNTGSFELTKPWFSRAEFIDPRGMSLDSFGSTQGSLLQELGLL